MSIRHLIVTQQALFSNSAKKIGQFILKHSEEIPFLSSQELALKINVSQSSIIKFTQRIGFKGYSAFKLTLSEEIGRQKTMPHPTHLHNQINANDPILLTAQKLLEEKSRALIETTNAINIKQFDTVVKLINKANRVQIIGIGGSGLCAQDLSFKLLKIGIITLCVQDSHVQIASAQTLEKKDVQIVISYSGNRKEMLLAAEIAHEKGAKVIAITSKCSSPLHAMADFCLHSIADETHYRSSSISSRTAQYVITDLLFLSLLQRREQSALTLLTDISKSIEKIL
ncbi:RpiR family transcriptional regulator protein [Psychromonas sp. CNPT3]|uniref:MurR/RpiR family transcriptional regulator n=1 Tax=Psychromonas sp. CNPT3 TaxID=314282 RepID=UPI00006E569C|nr:SIS domain-containing protein [Psychromonas sp. CNPT3]AGH81507.1 RpiR family transcriptional regulator protein [Psychromonas sp. CNPT3]